MWAVIIGGHALLITIFSDSGKRHVALVSAEAPSPGVLVLLDLPPPATEQAAPESPLVTPFPAPAISTRVTQPSLPDDSTAITLPAEEEAPPAGPIDWNLEAQRSARYAVDSSLKPGPKRIGEQPVSPFREKKKSSHEFQWDPEPNKAGLASGFIPYVRIGKRCILGLGFWGCQLGKLPEANSHLLDGMTDPDRPGSSVPDVDTSRLFDHPE